MSQPELHISDDILSVLFDITQSHVYKNALKVDS